MTIPCPVCVPCQEPSDPFQNFSSEVPDIDHFFKYGSSNGRWRPGPGRNWNVQTCLTIWGPISCYGRTEEEALACLQAFYYLCNPFVPPNPGPVTGIIIGWPVVPFPTIQFPWNTEQTCTFTCSVGGNTYTTSYTVPANSFRALTQASADALAYEFACIQARIQAQLDYACFGTGFGNSAQTCDYTCPSGDKFSATIDANTFRAVTQEEADQLAYSAACLNAQLQASSYPTCWSDGNDGVTPPPDGETAVVMYWNNPVNKLGVCPDGTTYQFYVPFGRFCARSQAQADAEAESYAQKQINVRKLCLGNLTSSECCENGSFSASITADGRTLSANVNAWHFLSGSFPAGVTITATVTGQVLDPVPGAGVYGGVTINLAGTPTTAGTYTFRLRVTTPGGDSMEKDFTICVVGIHPDTLDDGQIGVLYSQTLQADACATAPLSWQVFTGSLPTGLTLDEETGIISGTPTALGTYNFTILLQTQAT